MVDQGSAEWFSMRLGKVTASRIADVMAKTKTGPSASRNNYLMELLCQRLTGRRDDGFTSAAMQRGIDLEPLARAAYEISCDVMVQEASFVIHPQVDQLGASPDGLVGSDGLIEIKCPNTAQHIACIQSGLHDPKYYPQMQCQMACTGRDWCDFVSFDDRLPEPLQLFVCRVERSEAFIGAIMADVLAFLAELAELEKDMVHKMELAA